MLKTLSEPLAKQNAMILMVYTTSLVLTGVGNLLVLERKGGYRHILDYLTTILQYSFFYQPWEQYDKNDLVDGSLPGELKSLERFLCSLYLKGASDIPDTRWELFRSKNHGRRKITTYEGCTTSHLCKLSITSVPVTNHIHQLNKTFSQGRILDGTKLMGHSIQRHL